MIACAAFCGVTALDAADSEPVPTVVLRGDRERLGGAVRQPAHDRLRDNADVRRRLGAIPTYGVTTYPVIALPPSATGALQLTVACALPALAATPVGEPGHR